MRVPPFSDDLQRTYSDSMVVVFYMNCSHTISSSHIFALARNNCVANFGYTFWGSFLFNFVTLRMHLQSVDSNVRAAHAKW